MEQGNAPAGFVRCQAVGIVNLAVNLFVGGMTPQCGPDDKSGLSFQSRVRDKLA